jgi:hypothetical protein
LLLSSIGLGFAIGILLLFLLQTKGVSRRVASVRRPRQQTFDFKNFFKTNPFQSKARSQQSRAYSSNTNSSNTNSSRASRRTANSDWHEVPAQDWADTPRNPREAASPNTSFRDRAPEYDDEPPFEPSPSQAPSQAPKSERVVDADYRVLRQPYSPPPPDEEWEDDFFKDER